MKLDQADIVRAIAVMKESIDNFPTTPLGIQIVQDSIQRHISSREQLQSLVRMACDTVRRWSLPDFLALKASVSERDYFERETREYHQKVREWKKELKLLGESDEPDPFPIPTDAVKRIPGPEVAPKEEPTPAPRPPVQVTKRLPTTQEAEAELQEQIGKTPKRSPEETARMLADLEAQLALKKIVQ